MQPETGYPVETSSNPDGAPGLSNPSEDPWTPADSDESPSVTIIISDEDTFIESATVTGTENVKSVTVVVVEENGDEVCLKLIFGAHKTYVALDVYIFSICAFIYRLN